jgi:hypothetical protein
VTVRAAADPALPLRSGRMQTASKIEWLLADVLVRS